MTLQIAGAVAVGVWVYLIFARGGFWREFARVDTAAAGKRAATVVAVIPARNEAATIAMAAGSLRKQVSHVVVVDDDSEDSTAEAARGLLTTVIRSEPLPAGWTGKLWAVSQGVREAARYKPEYLLLTDADIVHPLDNAAGLVARARAGGFDLVSYMATLRCRSVAELALVPAFVFFFFMLYPPAWVRDPRRSTAGAAGGCMLIRWDALERIGGIEAIRGELIDDCALAAKVKGSGGRVWLGLGRETLSLREYGSFAEIGSMISRTAFTQLRYSPVLLAGTLAALAITYLLPPVLTLAATQPARGMGALAWLMMSIAYIPALRYYRRPIPWAPFLPLIALFYAGCTIHSAVRHWRGAGGLWKGRTQG
jgi:hopene-associated glycosyltransferase HpnB